MNSAIKVIVAIAWAVLLFIVSAVVEQVIKYWLWKSKGVCPVCSRFNTNSYVHAQDAQLV